jgi:nucleoside-diphosphate-sugar epimerase
MKTMVNVMGTYLVTGVSGELGSRLIGQLSAQANTERIIGVDRQPLRQSAPKLQYVRREIEDGNLSDLLAGVDALVNLAPLSPSVLRCVLDAANQAGVKQIVALSSAAVFGAWPTNEAPLTEDSPLRPNPGFAHAVEAAEIERLLYEYKRERPEVSVAIMRLAMVLGGRFEKALLGPLGVYAHRHLESSRPVQYLHMDDAVSALLLAATDALDGVFNVAPNGFIDDERARAVAGVAPRPGLPKRVAYVANDLVWRSRKRNNFAAAAPYLEHPWVMSNERLRAAGWAPTYSTEEALVAEARPSWWGQLRPNGRRAIVMSFAISGASLVTLGTAAVIRKLIRTH